MGITQLLQASFQLAGTIGFQIYRWTLIRSHLVATSDGERLVCIRVRNHAIEQPPSLYWSTTAGTTLNSKFPDHPDGLTNSNAVKGAEEHGEHIIVASEPSTYKAAEWNLIEKNHCLLYDGTLRLEEVQYPIKLNSSVDSL